MALAVLRAEGSVVVPEDFRAEALAQLVTRVLYRLRFQSEQKPFDASTFAMAAPLLTRCIEGEGLGLEKGDNDAAMEQLALVIDVIAFHVRACESHTFRSLPCILTWTTEIVKNTAFSRLQIINSLIQALLHFPSLSKASSDALLDLGHAIEDNATIDEINALLQGLLVDEAQVRLACLNALSVSRSYV